MFIRSCWWWPWLIELGVQEVVMESTAQYWRPEWTQLEPHLVVHLAHAQSNRAPSGRKSDWRDARRLVKRQAAGELFLSYVVLELCSRTGTARLAHDHACPSS